MRALLGMILVVSSLIDVPTEGISAPAAAIAKTETWTKPDPAWADCGIDLHCLR